MFDKVSFIIRNKLFVLSNEDLTLKCLDKDILISSLACEELVRRNPISINIDDDILSLVINNFSIEQVWDLVSRNVDSKLSKLAYQKLNDFLDYYDKMHEKSKVKVYLIK